MIGNAVVGVYCAKCVASDEVAHIIVFAFVASFLLFADNARVRTCLGYSIFATNTAGKNVRTTDGDD